MMKRRMQCCAVAGVRYAPRGLGASDFSVYVRQSQPVRQQIRHFCCRLSSYPSHWQAPRPRVKSQESLSLSVPCTRSGLSLSLSFAVTTPSDNSVTVLGSVEIAVMISTHSLKVSAMDGGTINVNSDAGAEGVIAPSVSATKVAEAPFADTFSGAPPAEQGTPGPSGWRPRRGRDNTSSVPCGGSDFHHARRVLA